MPVVGVPGAPYVRTTQETSLRPIPQTVETAAELGRYDPDLDVLRHLQDTADKVQGVVPDCIGLSIAWVDQGIAFTLASSEEEIAVLDAVQYLAGGPCVAAVERDEGIEVSESELMDEERWRMFGRATAHRAVRSTLTLPLVSDGDVVGSANLYAASDHAFEGHHDELARILGGRVSDVVRNADLSFSTRVTAEQAPGSLRRQNSLDAATGILAGAFNLDPDQAFQRLQDAAQRAGISIEQFAQALIELY